MPLPLAQPPEDTGIFDILPPDWVGPAGQPYENNRLPPAPPLDGSSLIQTLLNLVPNPSFEVDLANWTAQSTETATRTATTGAKAGVYSMALSGITVAFIGRRPGVTPALVKHTAAVWFTPASTGTYNLRMQDGAAAWTANGPGVAGVAGVPILLHIPVFTPGNTNALAMLVARAAGTFTGETVYFDDALIAVSDYGLPPFDGDAAESVWTGTAHNSTSRKVVHSRNSPPIVDWFILDQTTDFSTYPT